LLELGVVTAGNAVQWTRTLGRVLLKEAERSPFVHITRGRRFRVKLDRQLPYELDGGARPAARKLRIKVHPSSVRICVPADVTDTSLALLDQPAQVPANG
jgi:diacylglycerol kinase family enzyme